MNLKKLFSVKGTRKELGVIKRNMQANMGYSGKKRGRKKKRRW